MATADAVLVADCGRGLAAQPPVVDGRCGAGWLMVWDAHARDPAPSTATVVTTDVGEAAGLAGEGTPRGAGAAEEVLSWSRWPSACQVTWDALSRSPLGAERYFPTGVRCRPWSPPGPSRATHVGAGDRFAASIAVSLARGFGCREAAEAAVADGGGGPWLLRRP